MFRKISALLGLCAVLVFPIVGESQQRQITAEVVEEMPCPGGMTPVLQPGSPLAAKVTDLVSDFCREQGLRVDPNRRPVASYNPAEGEGNIQDPGGCVISHQPCRRDSACECLNQANEEIFQAGLLTCQLAAKVKALLESDATRALLPSCGQHPTVVSFTNPLTCPGRPTHVACPLVDTLPRTLDAF